MNTIVPVACAVLLGLAGVPDSADDLIKPHFHLSDFHAPLRIDNWYSPMEPGTYVVIHEREDGECKVNDVVVTNRVKRDFTGAYAGLATRVVTDRVYADIHCNGHRGALLEHTSDWYGQDDRGNVWYFGEDTIEYLFDDEGNAIGFSREGSWEAGRNASAGIVMFAHPRPGMHYRQEFSPGIAEDQAQVRQVGIRVATDLGHFKNCVKTRETTPLSPGDVEFKTYCPNLGLVLVAAPGVGGAKTVELGVR